MFVCCCEERHVKAFESSIAQVLKEAKEKIDEITD
jgi:hypothetical protein